MAAEGFSIVRAHRVLSLLSPVDGCLGGFGLLAVRLLLPGVLTSVCPADGEQPGAVVLVLCLGIRFPSMTALVQ